MRPQEKTLTLLDWYKNNARPLPWRESRDPYRIWISEVMLQQTTVAAVLPFFERFLTRFPSLESLAKSTLEDVYSVWSGLGYYSRARNLHAAAVQLSDGGFPRTSQLLSELPGFGPYTSRAVASFAFSEPVGVLDGNSIRFLCRYYGLPIEWWKPKERAKLQDLADDWVRGTDSHEVNQALIEIGATICTSQSPKCTLCPLLMSCQSRGTKNTEVLPLKKQKRKQEVWLWDVFIPQKRSRNEVHFGMTQKHDFPFLRNHWAWPGRATMVKQKPKAFDFQHAVTHHTICVRVRAESELKGSLNRKDWTWLTKDDLKKKAPTSLVQKALKWVSSPVLSQPSVSSPAKPQKLVQKKKPKRKSTLKKATSRRSRA